MHFSMKDKTCTQLPFHSCDSVLKQDGGGLVPRERMKRTVRASFLQVILVCNKVFKSDSTFQVLVHSLSQQRGFAHQLNHMILFPLLHPFPSLVCFLFKKKKKIRNTINMIFIF